MGLELTDLLLELESIQRDRTQNLARGTELQDILQLYEIPRQLYTLRIEAPLSGEARRTVALFNFGLVEEQHKSALIECLFALGYSPDFISNALAMPRRRITAKDSACTPGRSVSVRSAKASVMD